MQRYLRFTAVSYMYNNMVYKIISLCIEIHGLGLVMRYIGLIIIKVEITTACIICIILCYMLYIYIYIYIYI